MRSTVRLLLAAAAGVALGMGCSFTFSDDIVYSCRSDADCGTGGFTCTNGACCKATGDEVCGDGLDNDCDGKVDGDMGRVLEVCNGRDDDCDGVSDEGFDLNNSMINCGTCGNACDMSSQYCNGGACERRSELDCGNGIDDDGNGQVDCADPGCAVAACGMGCLCTGGTKREQLCEDGADNDGDSQPDCADPDCEQKACGAGCACLGGVAKETDCWDGLDNDRDAGADCNDPACGGGLCQMGTTRRCVGTACLCNGGAPVAEGSTAGSCGDGVDNDCNFRVDCRDPACTGRSCNPDGGPGCVCEADGGASSPSELACDNGVDDDGDGLVDCADTMDCAAGVGCAATKDGVSLAGTCGAGACRVEFCFDRVDNNGNNQTDCAEASCAGQSCISPLSDAGVGADGGTSCLCVGTAPTELNCFDGFDNNGTGGVDCVDPTCAGQRCVSPSADAGFALDGGSPCRCAGGRRVEQNCQDGLDNDLDGLVDCADSDCPRFTVCLRVDAGVLGQCTNQDTCN